MLLAVDVGNTKIKAAVFEGDALVEKLVFDKTDSKISLKNIFSRHPQILVSILSSVANADTALITALKENTALIEISNSYPFPFQNRYATPNTLGIDRMVLASGAVLSFPNKNRLVIDAGTCITYDFVDNDNNYLGGAISPGLRLRYNALHNFTAKLPLLSPEVPGHYIGNSTATSMHSGVVNGVVNEIEGFISQYVEHYQELTIILTGGDTEFLAKQLKSTIFANSNFLLESLNKLYIHIQSKND